MSDAQGDGMSTRTPKHGTVNEYGNYDCRCDDCRKAWNADCQRLRQRRVAQGICVECSAPNDGAHQRCAQHHTRMLKRTRVSPRKAHADEYTLDQLRTEMGAEID
jgi:hypothetical protein